ncbi:MAG: hypothetical protein LJE92_00345 [Gammaproteobacteria bacterium]|jgi:hypothetical protein|nr:hypothetical protein [Gammaproteobacteria bacterium]
MIDCAEQNPLPAAAEFRRPPEVVMRLARMGSFHQTRLSFMRTLLRRLKREQWRFKRNLWSIDAQGFGRAVYTLYGPERAYSLVAFSHDLPDHMRSDRVIATAWDATFALYDGIPDAADLDRLEQNVPKQEAGRVSDSELSLSRANRSVRLWQHVVEALSAGRQPDREQLEAVGYLVRTTAVYGSGKFGAADRLAIADRPEVSGPFQAELLSVWLIRSFALDLVEHVAAMCGGETAVVIEPEMRRRIGVGNSTGLGMAPFLINHPALLNNWMMAREEAIARVRSLASAETEAIETFKHHFQRARFNVSQWHSAHPLQIEKLAALGNDFNQMAGYIERESLVDDHPWDRFYRWAETQLSLEGQEQLVSLLLEPYGELVDGLTQCMDADEHLSFFIDGAMPLARLREILESRCQWALQVDYDEPANRARFWYTSAEKLEPRVGERFAEPGAEYELPLAVGYDIKRMYGSLIAGPQDISTAEFLLAHPEHRHTTRRVQNLATHPYAEIQDNLIAADMLPVDILRCKLSFFGATKFDPRSDRWVRICMYQDAPFPHELLAAAP